MLVFSKAVIDSNHSSQYLFCEGVRLKELNTLLRNSGICKSLRVLYYALTVKVVNKTCFGLNLQAICKLYL